MRQKSNKLQKLEKNRFSLFDNGDKCHYCPSTNNLTWHEIYAGRNRQNSMKYGMCLRLCINCHTRFQEDKQFNTYWHQKAQEEFIKQYTNLDFVSIFKKNYL